MQNSSRRRRKRIRPASKEGAPLPREKRVVLPSLDDSALNFLDSSGDFLSDGLGKFSSIPMLLAERQTCRWKQNRGSWHHQAVRQFVKKPSLGSTRRQWRPFATRNIPFTKLGTPISDAVLAMDRQGSYVLSLGTRDANDVPLALALRFYAIPSPAALQSKAGTSKRVSTPLIQTTPLLYDIEDESPEDAIFNFRRGISPATTPVKILLSNDWKMGVALFQPSNVWRESEMLGTLIVFSFHRTSVDADVSTTWKCTNIRIRKDNLLNRRNLLWRVDALPVVNCHELPDTLQGCALERTPGYVLFNDEEDGFRVTWFGTTGWGNTSYPLEEIRLVSFFEKASKAHEAIVSFSRTWERIDANIRTGEKVHPSRDKTVGLAVACESFLHIDVLLFDILRKRKGIGESRPEFVYNLISIAGPAQIANIVITFLRTAKKGALGVFVKVDLFLGMYMEGDSVKNLHCSDPMALREWCDALAVNRRMRERQMGPYSTGSKRPMDWSSLCVEKYFDADEADDLEPGIWKDYTDSGGQVSFNQTTHKAPKRISYASLYPDCDFVSNKALIECSPVSSLQSKDSPTQLVYG